MAVEEEGRKDVMLPCPVDETDRLSEGVTGRLLGTELDDKTVGSGTLGVFTVGSAGKTDWTFSVLVVGVACESGVSIALVELSPLSPIGTGSKDCAPIAKSPS